MEIPSAWEVQNFVRGVNVGRAFTTTDVLMETKRNIGASSILDNMACLDKVHKGSLGGQGLTRDPNVYKKISRPGSICGQCRFGKSGSSGCIITHPEMGEQFSFPAYSDLEAQTTGD